jgi:YbgC/YbaW family acyl-CoA thioester hydrolase
MRYELTAHEWGATNPMLPNKPRGVPRVNDRRSGQIVYHANFLRFMERGRTNYFRLLGTNQHALLLEARNDAPGFTFVVRSMTIDFLKPAVFGRRA